MVELMNEKQKNVDIGCLGNRTAKDDHNVRNQKKSRE